MPPSLTAVVAVFAAPAVDLPTEVWAVAPEVLGRPWWQPTPGRKDRAVVLLPGLRLNTLHPSRATRPQLHEWMDPKSEMVRTLAKDSDVFAFGYAQTVPVDAIPHSPGLRDAVGKLRAAGYHEIVLVGYSAGGVIARLYVESYPDAGVTRVIQIASPNLGSDLAAVFKTGYPRVQAPFVQSLAPEPRAEAFGRTPRKLAANVELACVVCKVRVAESDGVVPLGSQWPADLQHQGVPAALVPANHLDATKSPASIRVVADLVRGPLARWSPQQAEQARQVLFRDEPRK